MEKNWFELAKQICNPPMSDQTESPPICKKCGDTYTLRFDSEETGYCDLCAQEIVFAVESENSRSLKEIERLKQELANTEETNKNNVANFELQIEELKKERDNAFNERDEAVAKEWEIRVSLTELRADNQRLRDELKEERELRQYFQDKNGWEENQRLREALEKIANHKFISYEVARDGIYEGQYGIGVVDGHRACSTIAKQALANEEK